MVLPQKRQHHFFSLTTWVSASEFRYAVRAIFESNLDQKLHEIALVCPLLERPRTVLQEIDSYSRSQGLDSFTGQLALNPNWQNSEWH